MTSGSPAYLIDTNILVYAYDAAEPVKRERAIDLLDHLFIEGLGALSVQVLGEFFVTVTRKLTAPLTLQEAERSIRNYHRSWPVLDLGPTMSAPPSGWFVNIGWRTGMRSSGRRPDVPAFAACLARTSRTGGGLKASGS